MVLKKLRARIKNKEFMMVFITFESLFDIKMLLGHFEDSRNKASVKQLHKNRGGKSF